MHAVLEVARHVLPLIAQLGRHGPLRLAAALRARRVVGRDRVVDAHFRQGVERLGVVLPLLLALRGGHWRRQLRCTRLLLGLLAVHHALEHLGPSAQGVELDFVLAVVGDGGRQADVRSDFETLVDHIRRRLRKWSRRVDFRGTKTGSGLSSSMADTSGSGVSVRLAPR